MVDMVDAPPLDGQEPVPKSKRMPAAEFVLELIASARKSLEIAQRVLAKQPEYRVEEKRLKLAIDTVCGAWQRVDYRRRRPSRAERKRADKLANAGTPGAGMAVPTE